MSFTLNLANQKIEFSYLTRSRLQLHQQEIWVRDYIEIIYYNSDFYYYYYIVYIITYRYPL